MQHRRQAKDSSAEREAAVSASAASRNDRPERMQVPVATWSRLGLCGFFSCFDAAEAID